MNPTTTKVALSLSLLFLFRASSLFAQNAFTNDGAAVYLQGSANIYIQGQFENKGTGQFTNSGAVHITGNLVHNASVNLNATASGLFRLNGTATQLISGSNQPNFYNLVVDKTSGECELQTNISLSSQLTLSSGNVFLNNRQINLLTTGELIGETSGKRIYDNPTNTGTITITRLLNAPAASNPGNLGAIITSAQNLGSTIITRGHREQFIVSANSITRYYDISPAGNSGLNATLRFNYFDNELNGQVESNLVQWHSPDNGVIWSKRGGTINTSSDYVDLGGIDSFHRISLISNSIVPLPLNLLTFTAVKTNSGKVDLVWTTTQEINSSHFEIERSLNGRNWIKIGTKAAVGQQGLLETYSFADLFPGSEANYYRLRIVDLDNRFDYSPVRLIQFGKEVPVRIYPTIGRSNTTYFIEGMQPGNTTLSVYTNKGQLVQNVYLNSNSFSLPVTTAGIYHIRITDRNNPLLISTHKIVIY
ncbi:MAG: T9SS type A sorting domain-containing protein [Chitinophagaceae bacterium]|jgi:hypothetical protein|nr:T9SS type A sorting domain-containing protein [Chitinophagaceae bacterium]